MPDENSWNQWSRHVLAELERLDVGMKELNKTLTAIQVEIATLKVKSGVWGALGASVPILVATVIWLLTKK
jgi:hypothetical protein